MNIEEFYAETVASLPIIRQNNDFRKDLEMALNTYSERVTQIDIAHFASEEERENIITSINALSDTIKKVVNLYYDGRRANALQVFRDQMECPNGLFENIGIHSIEKITHFKEKDAQGKVTIQERPTVWFRARVFEDKQSHSFREMFHIPLDKRESVKTQRYSAQGYPCLYLGNTVYSCWEEMHRKRFDELRFSGFKVRHTFDVYDLRIPKRSDFIEPNFEKTLLRMPLIISSMVQVKNPEDPFKPEYIIPQLLIETIICRNREKWKNTTGPCDMPWGIIYTSTHINHDFPYGVDHLENIAIPVIASDDKCNYCEVLASLFDISTPLCLEYESLKDNNVYLSWGITAEMSQEEQIRTQYGQSKMGFLEGRIRGAGEFQTLDHFVINVPLSGVVIGQDGASQRVEIRASGPWTFETEELVDENPEGLRERIEAENP